MSLVSLICLRRVSTSSPIFNLAPSHLTSSGFTSAGQLPSLKRSHLTSQHADRLQPALPPSPHTSLALIPKTPYESLLFAHKDILLKSHLCLCSRPEDGQQPAAASEPKRSDKPTEEQLEMVASKVIYSLQHFFLLRINYALYRPDIIFENRISGKITKGAIAYFRQMSLLKIYGHLRFAFVRFACQSYRTNVQDGVIQIRWQITGLGMLKMIFQYFPKKLYRQKNMIENADVWFEGISYYYVDGEGQIYRHIIDNKEFDKDKAVGIKDKLREKVRKFATKSSNPAAI